MPENASASDRSPIPEEQSCAGRLAQLFPDAFPLQIAVRLVTMIAGRRSLQEQTVIEFGTANEALFGTRLPLEFEDCVRLINSDRSIDVHATVVAVRYEDCRKAVAARFAGGAGNWIVKP